MSKDVFFLRYKVYGTEFFFLYEDRKCAIQGLINQGKFVNFILLSRGTTLRKLRLETNPESKHYIHRMALEDDKFICRIKIILGN